MTDATRRERRLWLLALFVFIGTEAVGFQLRGALLPSIERTFRVSTELLGLVATAGTAGFVVAVLVSGFAAGRVDIKRAMLGSVLVVAAGAFATGLAPAFGVLLAALFVRGVATGPFRALDRVVLSHLFPQGRSRVFNLYGFVWAVGATAGPVVVTVALGLGNWRYAYALVGVGFLCSAALLVRLDLPTAVGNERRISADELRRVLRKPGVAGVTLAVAVNGGLEGSLFTWLPYFAAQQLPESTANLVLSTFLAAFLPGRLTYSVVTDRAARPLGVLLATLGAAVPVLVATVFLADGLALFAAVFVLGFLLSATFPTLSAVGVSAAPEYSGPVNAVLNAATYAGIAVVPPLVGVLASSMGITPAMGVLPALVTVVLVVTAATWRLTGSTETPAA